jgi:hypothetical protein
MRFTTYRFALQGTTGWTDLFFNRLRSVWCLEDGLLLYVDGVPPLKLALPWPEYFYVAFRFFAYGDVPPLALDAEFEQRAREAGRQLRALPSGPS